ncbi:MAG: ATP synthase A1 subunit C [Nanobdellota archaeon]
MQRGVTKSRMPYTFARVSAMRSKLIDRSEYIKLLKMDLNSITRYLQESEYKDSITELSGRYSGIELVDQALRRNKVRTFDKLRRISPPNVSKMINRYLCRWDYHNLKVVLRGLYSNTKKEEVSELIVAIGNFDKKHFENLFDKGEIWEALANSKIVTTKEIKEAYEDFKKTNKLIELENKIDHLSFEQSLCNSGEHEESSVFKNFLLKDIDITNIKNLIRFKKEKLNPAEIMKYMIIGGLKLDKKKLDELTKKDSVESLLEALSKTYYGKFINFIEYNEYFDIELALQSYILKSASLKSHQNPLSIACVLNFMMSKMVEIKNLRSLVKSKHLGVDEEYLEKKLLII